MYLFYPSPALKTNSLCLSVSLSLSLFLSLTICFEHGLAGPGERPRRARRGALLLPAGARVGRCRAGRQQQQRGPREAVLHRSR